MVLTVDLFKIVCFGIALIFIIVCIVAGFKLLRDGSERYLREKKKGD